ncbi:MAG: peroxiredoxin, partial [Opitutales bacterium]|nr:peroxiredoxin [Opitutales bacterium]
MKFKRTSIALAIIAMISSLASASLDVGNAIGSFAANDDTGNLWSLDEHIGKKNVVVYFYPAAMTGG